MASIADLFVRLMADDKGLEAQVTGSAKRAGDKAGTTMGQRMGAGIKAGAKAGLVGIGAVVGTAFGLGLRGVVELDTAMADFQATTGATQDEVNDASDAVLEFSRRNLQPIDEITDTMANLRTEMGLTQEQAEDMTEPFLKFAEVTGQQGPDAVSAFDDILDAWNLDASDSQGIMDKLIESHQRYGGSVDENQAMLAKLAPVMQGANLTYDDGIGLLNLFAASGIDASKAPQALTAALSKVKSPEQLQRLIDDITNTEDPFKRAQKAIDLFGARAGPQLAQALQPGSGGLDDFRVSTEEAAGATDEASDAFESSFGRQAQLWLNNIKGMATGLVQDLGPGIGGLAGAAAIGGPAIGNLFKLMGRGAMGVIPLLVGAIGQIGPALSLLMGPVGIIIAVVAGLFLAWQTNFLGIRDIVGNVVNWFVKDVLPMLQKAFDVLVTIIGTAFDVVVTIIKTAVTIAIEIFKVWFTVWSTIIGTIVNVVTTAIGIIGDVIGTIVGIVETMVGGVRGAMELFVGIFRTVGKFIGPIVDVILAPIRGIMDVVGTVVGAVAGLFDFITGGSKDAEANLNRVGKTATPTGQFVPGNMGGTRPPTAQEGAWRTTGGLWQLHADEMVVPPGPAQALRDWFGNGFAGAVGGRRGGDTYVVNVQGLLRARSAHDIGAGLRRLGERGQLVPPRRPMVNE